MESKILISVKDLSIGYEGKTLCSGISFDICKGNCIMLCGANGSGKTTLMKTIADSSRGRFLDVPSGEAANKRSINIDGQIECIMIPARIPKVAGFTLKEFVRVSCFSKSDLYGKLSPSEEAALDQSIETLGLTHLADKDISNLSDGEFQKAGIASALVRKADIIMLDEPTAFLDAENRINVLKTLRALCDHGQAIIFSTHDLHDGLKACTKVFALGADYKFHTNPADTQDSKVATISCIFSR